MPSFIHFLHRVFMHWAKKCWLIVLQCFASKMCGFVINFNSKIFTINCVLVFSCLTVHREKINILKDIMKQINIFSAAEKTQLEKSSHDMCEKSGVSHKSNIKSSRKIDSVDFLPNILPALLALLGCCWISNLVLRKFSSRSPNW